MINGVNGLGYKLGGVIHRVIGHPFGKILGQLGHFLFDGCGGFQGIGPWQLIHQNPHSGFFSQITAGVVIIQPQLHATYVFQTHQLAVLAGFDDDGFKVFGLGQAPLGLYTDFKRGRGCHRLLAQGSRWHLNVLAPQGIQNIPHHHIP